MRNVKYVKRTGTPGSYQYWYKMPDGTLTTGNDADQKRGKLEHVKRLIASKRAGHHDMTYGQIKDLSGHAGSVAGVASNMSSRGGPDFTDHHLKEAHHSDTQSGEYVDKIARNAGEEALTPSAAPARVRESAAPESGLLSDRRPRPRASGGSARRAATRAAAAEPTPAAPSRDRVADRVAAAAERALAGRPARTRSSTRRTATRAAAATPAPAMTESPGASDRVRAVTGGGAPDPEARKKELREKLQREHGLNLWGEPESAAAVQESARRVAEPEAAAAPAAAPAEPAREPAREEPSPAREEPSSAREVSPAVAAADPALGESERAIQEIVTAQRNGENPYLKRSVEIYNRIKGSLKPERKEAVSKFLQAVQSVKMSGDPMTPENVFQVYKNIPGNERKRVLPHEHIEKGLFHTSDEIIGNPPVKPEVERMKRGYTAKQFLRLKPFLKQSWLSGNSSAPPPMPTFGDIKSWGEHGGAKPSWAGNTRIAVPEEVFNAAHKVNGKPVYPPAWMPIHLMPVWNYIAAKVPEPYVGRRPSVSSTGKIQTEDQSGYQEGMALNSLRKYVAMRGGSDQLIDIPESKLAEVNLTHEKIFKSDKGVSDEELKKLILHKFIDPVDFINWLEKTPGALKKSFSLVVKSDEIYKPGDKLEFRIPLGRNDIHKAFPPEHFVDIRKSRIDKIKGILNDRHNKVS